MKYINAPDKPEGYGTREVTMKYFSDVKNLAKESGELVRVCAGMYFMRDMAHRVWEICSRDDLGQRNFWDIKLDGTFEYLDPAKTLKEAVDLVKDCGQDV